MELPPVINLINATFDQLGARQKERLNQPPPKAPQPIITSQPLQEGSGLGLNAAATDSTNRVGTVLNAEA